MITNAFVQARMSSTRLPGKVLADIEGKPMIVRQLERLKRSKEISQIIVLTSTDTSDDILSDLLTKEGVNVFRGSLGNVLERYMQGISFYPCDFAVRITADCPLIDPEIVDATIIRHKISGADYTSNSLVRMFPRGLDCEVFSPETLYKVSRYELSNKELEHVTLGIYGRPSDFNLEVLTNSFDESHRRWTVDTADDLKFVRIIYKNLLPISPFFTSSEIRDFLRTNPDLENYEVSN